VAQLTFAPDGSRLAGAGFYSATGQWWTPTGADLGLLEGHTTRLRSIAFDPQGRWLATGDRDGNVLLRDPTTGDPLETLAHEGEAAALAFSPAAPLLAVATTAGTITLWNLDEGGIVATWPALGTSTSITFTPGGRMLLTGSNTAAARLWAIPSGERLATLSGHGAAVNSVAVSADGSTIVTGSQDARVIVWRYIP
jgi:WD40 repeat protein